MDERAIVVLVIKTNAGRAIVGAAGGERGFVELVHLFTGLRDERAVRRFADPFCTPATYLPNAYRQTSREQRLGQTAAVKGGAGRGWAMLE